LSEIKFQNKKNKNSTAKYFKLFNFILTLAFTVYGLERLFVMFESKPATQKKN